MMSQILPLDGELRTHSRLHSLATRDTIQALEWLALIGAGASATLLTTFVDLHLQIPGHSIVLVVFPLALGFALVPRRRAGTTMGFSALSTTLLLTLTGTRVAGPGGLASLLLTGPCLDLALRWGGRGWHLYAAFVIGGAASNAAAFVIRALTKVAGIGGPAGGGGRAMGAWLPQAVWTYALAGVVAGLISAATWFHAHERLSSTD